MRKNILILGHNDATQFIDIYNQYTRLFDPELFEVTVAYLSGAPNENSRERTIAEKVLFLSIPKNQLRMLKIKPIKKLLALVREKQFELVICHRYKPTYIMLWVNLFHRIPTIIGVMHELGTMSARARQLLVTMLGRKNFLLAGVSNAVRDDLRQDLKLVPKERVTTLYNMIDTDITEPALFSREEARKKLNLEPQDLIFGNVARLEPNKDQTTLIKAFASIKQQHPTAKLLLIGDGSLTAQLKTQVEELGLEQNVIFTGFLPSGFRYMKAFDCFVLTSTQEAFGRVLLEAMIAKLPIIATKTNGIPEVVGEAGTIIPASDVASLTNAMQHIASLSTDQRNHLGNVAYQRAQDHFSIPCFRTDFWNLPQMSYLKE